jgi:hypothetical protein
LENLDDNVSINRVCGSIIEDTHALASESLGYYEFWFAEECSKLLYQRKQAKLVAESKPNKQR